MDRQTAHTVLAALADPTRQQIVEMLSDGTNHTLSELAGHFDMSRQAVSKHLSILNEAGIVISERHGRDRRNRLSPDGLDPLRDWFNRYSLFWDERLQALKLQIEEEKSS